MTPQLKIEHERNQVRPRYDDDIDRKSEVRPYQLLKEIRPRLKVSACAFSPKHLAVGCEKGSVIIYQVLSWKVCKTYYREKKIRIVRFSPCFQYLGVGSDDGTVALLNLENNLQDEDGIIKNSSNVIKRDALIHALSFSPNGQELIFGGFDGKVAIMNVTDSGLCVDRELPRLGVILSLDYSPCGQYVAIGASDMCVTIVQSKDLSIVTEFKRLSSVQCVEWHPSGELIAAGGRDGIVAIYNFASKNLEKEIFPSSSKRVLCIGWNVDGSIIAIGGTDEFISLFETKGFEAVQEIPRVGHVTSLAFHKEFFAVCGNDSKISIFRHNRLKSGQFRRRLSQGDRSLVDKCHPEPTPVNGERASGATKCPSLIIVPRSWIRPEPLSFLEKSEEFLEKCTLNPTSTMSTISFLTAVRMLRHYLKRIRMLEDDRNVIALSLKDDLDFINVICNILQSSIDGMKWNCSRKYNITAKDTRRIQVWNVKWRRARIVDPPFLDVDLLRSVDSPPANDSIDVNGDVASTASLTSSIDTVEESIVTFHKQKSNYSLLSTITDSSTVDHTELSRCGSKISKINGTWADVNEPAKFLQSCKTFLSPFDNAIPPSHLRSFVSAVLMLQCHVQWINSSLNKIHETRLIKKAHTLNTLCQVLRYFTIAMDKISHSSTTTIPDLSSALLFKLSSKDINSLNEWNSIFKSTCNEYLPLVDISLLETVIDDLEREDDSSFISNTIDAFAKNTIPCLKEEFTSDTGIDQDSTTPSSINDLDNIYSKKAIEQIADYHSECSQVDDCFSHLLWSSSTEPHFKPLLLPTSPPSKINSSMPRNKLNYVNAMQNMQRVKMDAIDIKTPSKTNSNKLSANPSSHSASKQTNFSRLYSQLKTNLAKESDRSVSSRSYRSIHTAKSSIPDFNKRRVRQLGEVPSIVTKHVVKPESSVTHSAMLDAQEQIVHKDQQQHKVHKNDEMKAPKPKLIVSHIPYEILPRSNANRPPLQY